MLFIGSPGLKYTAELDERMPNISASENIVRGVCASVPINIVLWHATSFEL